MQPTDPTTIPVALEDGDATVTREGEGPPILLVHGLPGSVRDYRYLAPALAATGFEAIRVDLPGFGGSASRPGLGPEAQATFVAEVIEALGLDRPLVLGHSMGATYTLTLGALRPDRVKGIALLAPPGLRPHRGFRRIPASTVARGLRQPLARRLLRRPLRRAFVAGGFRHPHPDAALVRTILLIDAFDFVPHRQRVARLEVPTWVGWCRDDPLVEDVIVRELADAARAQRRLVFADGGHNPQKPHAETVAADLWRWHHELA